MNTVTARILIADDHELLRGGLVKLLEHEFEIVGETSDGTSTLRAISATPPDVLLLDLHMPACDPAVMIATLRRDHPEVRIVVMTGTEDQRSLHALLGVGASAIVLKSSGVARLREAITRVLEHRVYVDPDLSIDAAPDIPAPLTPREREVMAMLAQGDTYRDIGSRLHLGERTIETYRRRIADKLGLRSRAELVAYAIRHGFVHRVDTSGSG